MYTVNGTVCAEAPLIIYSLTHTLANESKNDNCQIVIVNVVNLPSEIY